jgi:hypothetical protein
MAVRTFLRATFTMMFWLSSAVMVVLAGAGYAQPESATTQRILISEDLTFSWPIVVLIVVSAVGYGGVVWSVRQHHQDKGIHLSVMDIAAEFRRKSECTLQHVALAETLKDIKDALREIKEQLPAKVR